MVAIRYERGGRRGEEVGGEGLGDDRASEPERQRVERKRER
jgi:hypothetical protein